MSKRRVDISDVQGNILIGFNKPNVRLIFFKFGENKGKTKNWLADLADRIPNTKTLMKHARKLNEEPRNRRDPNYRDQETWLNVSLSKSGIVDLGLSIPPSMGVFEGVGKDSNAKKDQYSKDPTNQPMGSEGPFNDEMKNRANHLGDTDNDAPENWDEPYKKRIDENGKDISTQIDALFIVAADQEDDLSIYSSEFINEATTLGNICVGVEIGKALLNEQGKQVEHFGFRDGVSQPLIVGVDHDKRVNNYDRFYPEDFVLFDLTGDQSWANNGSFLAFRKLEQDVHEFWSFMKRTCEKRATGLSPEHLAAKIVGRWKSGAPITEFPKFDPVMPEFSDHNDFKYLSNKDPVNTSNDPDGDITPTFAHTRWANPRDWSRTGSKVSSVIIRRQNHDHRILRRGIPYGPPWAKDLETNRTEQRRGLLFICYQRDLEKQFDHVQRQLSKVPGGYPSSGKNDVVMKWLEEDDNYTRKGLERWVTTKGGCYFFSPSISALKDLRRFSIRN